MVEHQYKVMVVSIVVGLVWIGVYHLLVSWWFLSRLSLLMAIISFVPAALVVLIHAREFGPFLWWDKSNVVLTTRRPPISSPYQNHRSSQTSMPFNGNRLFNTILIHSLTNLLKQ